MLTSNSSDHGAAELHRGSVEVYVGLKDFYVRHMAKRDSGYMDQWLADFDDNATLSTNILDVSAQEGRGAIGAGVHALNNWFVQRGIRRNHLLSMFVTTRGRGDGTIGARHYGLLLTEKMSEGATIHSFSVARDVLQYGGGGWRILSRHVERDDLQKGSQNYVKSTSFDRREETLMVHSSVSGRPATRAEIYYSIEQFYAYQMQVLDSGDAAGWAATFTNDGVFSSNGMQNPITGYDELLVGAEKAISLLISDGITRRHFLSTLTIDDGGDDSVRARCYVLVIDTCNGETVLRMSTVMEDLLVFSAVGWLVQERTVRRDGLT